MTVRSDEFACLPDRQGVRKLKTRRGDPLRSPALGARRVAPYLFHKDREERHHVVKYSAIRIPQSAIGNKGFTLIEVMILIIMAGILLPAIIVPFVTAVKGSGKPEMVNTAIYLGHQKMEEFMKFKYTDSALDPVALTSYADISGFSGYQWQWERLYVDSDFNVVGDGIQSTNHRGYKRILVRVKDPMNDTYEIYSVVTYFP